MNPINKLLSQAINLSRILAHPKEIKTMAPGQIDRVITVFQGLKPKDLKLHTPTGMKIEKRKITKQRPEQAIIIHKYIEDLKQFKTKIKEEKGKIDTVSMSHELDELSDDLREQIKKLEVQQLLKEAFLNEDPSTCHWLITSRNADLTEILADLDPGELTESQKELKTWLEHFPSEISTESLDTIAIEQGYGYKAANLKVLESMTNRLNEDLKNCQIKVPPFVGVSSFEVTQHIKKHEPEILAKWEKFKGLIDNKQKSQFLKAQKNEQVTIDLNDEALHLLQEIGNDIQRLFVQHPLITLGTQQWLEEVNPELVIVRSTGKEDSDELANAGGNESYPFVKPTPEQLSIYIGKCIASYFFDPDETLDLSDGPRSIRQRIAAGDQTLFTEAPFMPFLIQEMVMENKEESAIDPQAVLRSGVIFSRPQRDLPDAVLIETGMGNNHGIVSCEVAVDSYFVKGGQVDAIVRHKAERFLHEKEEKKYSLKKSDK